MATHASADNCPLSATFDREDYEEKIGDACLVCPGRLVKVAERYRDKLPCENDSTKCGLYGVCVTTIAEVE